MSYHITNYTYKQAKRLGVVVKPSLNKDKKIDVYRTSKTGTSKTGTSKTGTSKTGISKTGTRKTGTSKTGTRKTGTMKKIASVGAAGMNDFPTYIQKKGLAFAKTRRRLYKMRHEKDRKTKWTRGWLADQLLW